MNMDPISGITKWLLHNRVRAIGRYNKEYEKIQRNTLERLLKKAARTEWGRRYGFAGLESYEQFAAAVPITRYDNYRDDMVRIMNGARDVIWPGQIPYVALSSGTTSDKSKFLPVTRECLRLSHLRGGRDVTASYLANNPDARVATGCSLALSGSLSDEFTTKYVKAGTISSIMGANIPPFFRRLLRFLPPKEINDIRDAHEKFDAVARYAMTKNVTSIGGAPSWMLAVINRMLEFSGKKYLDEIWPNLELFALGGMGFEPYRPIYEQLIRSPRMHYVLTYNASEGFFGVQTDPSEQSLTLMLDYGNFFEFIPMSVYGTPEEKAVPLWEVEPGVEYSLVISTTAGLWRYDICDIIRFTGKEPYRFVITGRTHQTLNCCGEKFSVEIAEKGLAWVCEKTGAQAEEFTVAPEWIGDDGHVRHQWLVEFQREPESLEEFAALLDKRIKETCGDYSDKRSGDTPLLPLSLIKARPGLFHDWLSSKGKYGGQHKVPRVSADRKHMDELLRG